MTPAPPPAGRWPRRARWAARGGRRTGRRRRTRPGSCRWTQDGGPEKYPLNQAMSAYALKATSRCSVR